MANLWIDGFDYATATADIATRYASAGNTLGIYVSSSGGRRSGRCLSGNGSPGSPLVKVLAPADATCIIGCARSFSNNNAATIVTVSDATVTHVAIGINTDGSLSAYRGAGSTLLGTSAAGAFDISAGFSYLEVKVTVNDTTGLVVVRVNGTTVLNLTGIDTRNGGTAGWTKVGFSQANFTTSLLDDLYINDGSGSENNDFLGDCRVDVALPTANGTTSGSTPSTGTNRGATVDDAAPNGDTDYNSLATSGDTDTLVLADNPNTGAVPLAVQVSISARKTDAGAGSLGAVLRISGTDYDGTSVALDTSYKYQVSQNYSQDPSGAAWTEATFNAMEVGYKRTA